MNTSSALIVVAAIVAIGLLLSGGMYGSSASGTNSTSNTVIYNKFTGRPVISCSTLAAQTRCTSIAVGSGW